MQLLLLLLLDLALCLVVSGHASTQTCAQGSTGPHVWWVIHARLASPSRLPYTTFHRESPIFVHFGFVRPALEVRTETDLHLLGLLILSLCLILDHWNLSPHSHRDLGNLIDDLPEEPSRFFSSLDVQNIFVCTFGSSQPWFGYWICSFCTTGTSTILSVNFRSFLCLLRRWHLHQDFWNPSQRLNMTLPQRSARYALG